MADRLKTFTSNLIRFAAGERPSADKFNAANEYLGRNIRDIFKAIGDMYGQGYPHLIDGETHLTGKWNPHQVGGDEGRALDIVNLARLIGPASNLNPKQLYENSVERIEEIIPAGVGEYQTKFPFKTSVGLAISIEGYAEILGINNFTNNNQFKVSYNKNTIYFSEITTSELTVIYRTEPKLYQGGGNYLYAGFNVIPDPNQASKLEIISDPNDPTSYRLNWSETTIEAQQSGLIDLNTTSTAGEWNEGKTATLPRWMWIGDDPLFSTGTIIPEGFLYVKNLTTNECYLSATYTFLDQTSIKISGVTLCLTDEYQIVTVGTDITTSIDDLRNKWFNHRHDGSFGEPRISVKDLVGKYLESADFEESSIADNDFPMYLHRKGYQEDNSRRNANNAMLGDIVMGQSSFDDLDPNSNVLIIEEEDLSHQSINLNSISNKILFGETNSFISQINGCLNLKNNASIKFGLDPVDGSKQYIRNEREINDVTVTDYLPSVNIESKFGGIEINSKRLKIDTPSLFLQNTRNTKSGFYTNLNLILSNILALNTKEKHIYSYLINEYASLNNENDFNNINSSNLNEETILNTSEKELLTNHKIFNKIERNIEEYNYEKVLIPVEFDSNKRKYNNYKSYNNEIFNFEIQEVFQNIFDGNNVQADLINQIESDVSTLYGNNISLQNELNLPVYYREENNYSAINFNSTTMSNNYNYATIKNSVNENEHNFIIEDIYDNSIYDIDSLEYDLNEYLNNYKFSFKGNLNFQINRINNENFNIQETYNKVQSNCNLTFYLKDNTNGIGKINYKLLYEFNRENIFYKVDKINHVGDLSEGHEYETDFISSYSQEIGNKTLIDLRTALNLNFTNDPHIVFIEEKIKGKFLFLNIVYLNENLDR